MPGGQKVGDLEGNGTRGQPWDHTGGIREKKASCKLAEFLHAGAHKGRKPTEDSYSKNPSESKGASSPHFAQDFLSFHIKNPTSWEAPQSQTNQECT